MGREAWQAPVHGDHKEWDMTEWAWLSDGQLAREKLHTNRFEDPDCIWKEGQSLHKKSGLSMIKMGAESLENWYDRIYIRDWTLEW